VITLHCTCGAVVQASLGPPTVACTCGKVHKLPGLGPPPAPRREVPAEPAPKPPPPPARRHPEPLPGSSGRGSYVETLRNPAVAGGVSVAVLLVAVLLAWGLRKRAENKRMEAASPGRSGQPYIFEGAGVEFVALPSWKLTKNENLVFEFKTPEGQVSVAILHLEARSHEDRVRAIEPQAEWGVKESELPQAECLGATFTRSGAQQSAVSYWLERKTHRLWVYASGKPGIRNSLKPLFESMKLSEPAPPRKPPPRPPPPDPDPKPDGEPPPDDPDAPPADPEKEPE
jgi:hypothetical protein